jgi:ankyrin repeat protein
MEETSSPLLHLAIKGQIRDLELVKFLIEQGAKIEIKNGEDDTPPLALADIPGIGRQ